MGGGDIALAGGVIALAGGLNRSSVSGGVRIRFGGRC